MLIAAIGDIHGCCEELDLLLERVLRWFNGRDGKIVFLGDYIDRGPDSRGVIDRLRNWNEPNIEAVFLRGNHEEMMIQKIIYDNIWGNVWRNNGGMQTLISIGSEDIVEYSQWLEANTVLTYATDGLLFVHAGINPDHSLEEQTSEDYLWIRNKFLRHTGSFGPMIVHGHTPMDKPEIKPNRINLDTACCYGGALSAGLFENDKLVSVISVPRLAAQQ